MNESTTRTAQGATRTCTTACTTEAPEQGRSNPCRHRTAHRANPPHLPSLSLSLSLFSLSLSIFAFQYEVLGFILSRFVVLIRVGVDYKVIKRELRRKLMLQLIHECRCDERLKDKAEGSTRLVYTGLCGGPEHSLEDLKIETRLIDD